jgi:hypothetical protein
MFGSRKLLVTAAVLAVALSGCSMTLGVQGAADDGSETFTGTATGYMDGSGTLQIHSDKGRSCVGDCVYINTRQ